MIRYNKTTKVDCNKRPKEILQTAADKPQSNKTIADESLSQSRSKLKLTKLNRKVGKQQLNLCLTHKQHQFQGYTNIILVFIAINNNAGDMHIFFQMLGDMYLLSTMSMAISEISHHDFCVKCEVTSILLLLLLLLNIIQACSKGVNFLLEYTDCQDRGKKTDEAQPKYDQNKTKASVSNCGP